MDTFGVIVICTKRDYLFAKGCCASIRHFMGDVPLCLLVDGDFDYSNLLNTYDAQVIDRNSIRIPELKKRSFGWGITKMIAFWESPFEHFLVVDSDTCIWGDMRVYAQQLQSYDVILDRPCYTYSEQDICDWFFNVEKIKKIFSDFHPLAHPYVCSGVFFAKKNIFTIKEYMDILDLTVKHPDLFFPGEMGFINLMIYKAKETGLLKVANEDIQYLVCDFKASEMRQTFPVDKEPVVTKAPTVLHFTGGIKPIMYDNPDFYTEPIIYFRRKYLMDKAGISGFRAKAILQYEDIQWKYRTQLPYYKKRLTKFFKF